MDEDSTARPGPQDGGDREAADAGAPSTTWADLHAETVARLDASGVGDPGREARWIVERVAGDPYVQIMDDPVTVRSHHHWRLIVERRETGEPLQYALERWPFRQLDLFIDRRVLIPRPETEEVAGAAIAELRRIAEDAGGVTAIGPAVDLGTGSGAIALALATELPGLVTWGTDASPDPLAVARANLAGIGRMARHVRLAEGSWFAALAEELAGTCALVVSNPPYVPDAEELPAAVADWEPASALRAGSDGLDDIRTIVAEAPHWLSADGVLVVEHGEAQAAAVRDLAVAAGFGDVITGLDLAGRPRYLRARR